MDKQQLKKKIDVAAKQQLADIVIKNGKIIDVFNLNIIEADVAIMDGTIVGIGHYEGKEIIDAKQRYICPGLIDGHAHLESSFVTPQEYANVVVQHGVTTVITDPHEIANVLGIRGIEYMLEATEHLPIDVMFMLPSCVPSTSFEQAGAVLGAEQLAPFFSHHRVLGLGEVMDFPAVKNCDTQMINKLSTALQHSYHLDGHCAGLTAEEVNVFRAAGIRTDHECTTPEEALEQIKRGMYVMMRESSAAKDLLHLLPAVNHHNSRRFLFCTDGKMINDLIHDGSIDHHIRLSIQYGILPLLAVQMATLNAAECYGFTNKGAIAPGYQADFLFVDQLDSFEISAVFKNGKLVAENGRYINSEQVIQPVVREEITKSMHMKDTKESDFSIKMVETNDANIMKIIPNSLYTEKLVEKVDVRNGMFMPSVEKDQLKIAVIERHHDTDKIGLGIVKGFQIKTGAIASTFSHDSHHLVTVGTNDRDMRVAANELKQLGGGLIVVKDGETLAALSCPIAGLISLKKASVVNEKLLQINKALKMIGASNEILPFHTLSFLCLPVIPTIKLTCNGMFDVENMSVIPISAR